MPARILDGYQSYYGKANSDKLEEPKAETFVVAALKMQNVLFQNLIVPRLSVAKSEAWIHMHLAATAASSAYLDLENSLHHHEAPKGPSSDKKAAALACWINRTHPLQVSPHVDHDNLAYLNAFLALSVAINTKFSDDDAGRDELLDRQGGSSRWRDLIYVLMWRNPSYRELTTIFSLL